MSDIKVPQAKYFNLSAYQVLRGMVRLYGLQEVWSALSEIAAEPLLAADAASASTAQPSPHSNIIPAVEPDTQPRP